MPPPASITDYLRITVDELDDRILKSFPSLHAFVGPNFTTVLAGIWMGSPVWGLRPVRALGTVSRSHLRLGIDSVSTRIPSVRPIHIAAVLLH